MTRRSSLRRTAPRLWASLYRRRHLGARVIAGGRRVVASGRRVIAGGRRVIPIALWACAAACGDDAPAVAPPAVAGPDTLTVEVLSNWMVLGQPLPVSVEVADGLARHWSEMTALALLERGRLRDPDFVASVVWPEVRGVVLDSALARQGSSTTPLTPEEVEAVFQQGQLRIIARVLRRASPEAHPEERQRQRDEAFAIRRSLTQGASWNEAVARSEDEASREAGGLLGLVGPGDLEPGLEGAAFDLEPGAISSVVETQEGYQILFRPRLGDVRELFEDGLRERQQRLERVSLMDSLVTLSDPVLEEGAGSRLLEMARATGAPRETGAAATDGAPLARWQGGTLSDTTAARYLTTLPPEDRRRLLGGPQQDAADLVLEIVRQEILWRELAPQDDPEVADWEARAAESARRDWLAALESLEAGLGLGEEGDAEARQKRIADYVEAVVSRRQAPLPTTPAAVGLATAASPVVVDAAGLRTAVERARRLLESAQGGM